MSATIHPDVSHMSTAYKPYVPYVTVLEINTILPGKWWVNTDEQGKTFSWGVTLWEWVGLSQKIN